MAATDSVQGSDDAAASFRAGDGLGRLGHGQPQQVLGLRDLWLLGTRGPFPHKPRDH